MLTSYKIEGFKSFKEEAVIDVKPTNYKILSERNIYNSTLKGLMFVGANASGKSNAVMALRTLLELLFANYDISLDKYVCLFSPSGIIKFTYNLIIDEAHIQYYIEYDSKMGIITERLHSGENLLLERMGTTAKSYIEGEIVYNDITSDVLILREIYFNTKFRANKTLYKWFEFLRNSVYIDLYTQKFIGFNDEILHTNEYLKANGDSFINDFFERYQFSQRICYEKEDNSQGTVFFIRPGFNSKIPYSLESQGNQNLLMLLNKFFYVIERGGMLILDEFSSGFHNDLEELLIRYFMEEAKESQLFFVSHSTNLLSNRLLRPDQIYAVDFVGGEGSVIKRFSDFQPREAQNLEKMYLGGVFDGLPNYSNDFKQE